MKFEHLVEINDLQDPMCFIISRAQLWRGLVMRAEQAQLFITYIDECIISERHESGMKRANRFGELVVHDQVYLQHEQSVRYEVAAQGEINASSLVMSIEEPQENSLFVRFSYDYGDSSELSQEQEMYNSYRRAAYVEADVETIRMIRELAEVGRLDQLLS
jgi:hypothetical protein